MVRIAPLIVIAAMLTCSTVVNAWGGEGHQVIAWIAEDRLTDRAKADVKGLLGNADLSDGEVANWADQVRRERRQSAPWHYVNIPVDAKGYDAKRDGHGGNNVIDAVTRFKKVLADPAAPREQRIEALKFLVHFVGDLRQPLHCDDRNGDKGGNARLVFFPGERKAMPLHRVWDTFLLKALKGIQSVAEYGRELNARVTQKQADEWTKRMPTMWAIESWEIAREKVYADVPPAGPPVTLSDQNVGRCKPVVDEQLEKAGVRLASLLNEVFR